MERGRETKKFEFGDWVPAVILFLFLRAIIPDLASLKISARLVSLNSCAVNKFDFLSLF
jgi:hypothetical protein